MGSRKKMKSNAWFYYRLSDMVKRKHFRDRENGRKLHYELYPDSIASQYMRQTDKNHDIDVLINLIKKHRPNLRPEEGELVVHLRVGDVVNEAKYTVKELLEKERAFSNGNFYVKPLSYYECHPKTKNGRIEKITLVAGGCKAHDFTKSKEYIQAIKNFFEESGVSVQTRLGNNPDDDFVYMCRSRFFIRSGGGFSRFVEKCRREAMWRGIDAFL